MLHFFLIPCLLILIYVRRPQKHYRLLTSLSCIVSTLTQRGPSALGYHHQEHHTRRFHGNRTVHDDINAINAELFAMPVAPNAKPPTNPPTTTVRSMSTSQPTARRSSRVVIGLQLLATQAMRKCICTSLGL